LGEVGLDNQLLSGATESASLVANACVCCTGLPGLAEALEDLFWARLERRMHRFPNLVIETTGLAEPGPVAEALRSSDLLKERYRLAGVITCLSAATAHAVLTHHAEARAQLAGANVLVITKADLVNQEVLQELHHRIKHELMHHDANAKVTTSAHSSLTAAQMLTLLQEKSAQSTQPAADCAHHHAHADGDGDESTHEHHHSAQAYFWPVPEPLVQDVLQQQIVQLQGHLGAQLLRIKGRVLTTQGPCIVQMAPFETVPVFQVDSLNDQPVSPGLTVIVALPLSADQQLALHTHIAP
jgi:G3E family GTPase